jgi:Putative peptidoglycan binding domain
VKIIGTFGVVVTASIALLQPAQGGSRGSGHSFSPAPHYSASAGHFSSSPRSFSGGAGRFYGPSTRFSSQAAFQNRAYSSSGSSPRFSSQAVFRTSAYSASGPRLAVNRTTALRSQGFTNQGRVLARSSRNWDRNRDHFWHGHRCRFFNNSWVIFDLGFYPWDYGYGYYPYGAYSYYDGGYYDDVYAPSEYSQGPSPAQSQYDSGNRDSSVSQVQAALAREGYYRGAIDGSLGPATRNALRRYQRNHGLDVTGRVDRPMIEALGLR